MSKHREIMEKHLGRKLLREEVVHHKNNIMSDNRLENLLIMSPAEHVRLHHSKEYKKYLKELSQKGV